MIINMGGMPLHTEIYHFLYSQGIVNSWAAFAKVCCRSRTYFSMLSRTGSNPSAEVWGNMVSFLDSCLATCNDVNTRRWL